MWNTTQSLSILEGLTLSAVIVDRLDETITFRSMCGRGFKMYHSQDCCESVEINDIEGDVEDLVGSPITVAEEVNDSEMEVINLLLGPTKPVTTDSSETWTFYRIATAKGWVVIRWYGTSNGYYSESVDFCEITPIDAQVH